MIIALLLACGGGQALVDDRSPIPPPPCEDVVDTTVLLPDWTSTVEEYALLQGGTRLTPDGWLSLQVNEFDGRHLVFNPTSGDLLTSEPSPFMREARFQEVHAAITWEQQLLVNGEVVASAGAGTRSTLLVSERWVVAGNGLEVLVYDLETGDSQVHNTEDPTSVYAWNSSAMLLTGDELTYISRDASVLRTLHLETGEAKDRPTQPTVHTSDGDAVDFRPSPNGFVFTDSGRQEHVVIDRNGMEQNRWPGAASVINANRYARMWMASPVVWREDGRYRADVLPDGNVQVVDTCSGGPRFIIEAPETTSPFGDPHISPVVDLLWAPDDNLLLRFEGGIASYLMP